MAAWTYTGVASPERRRALESPMAFSELVSALKSALCITCFHREPKDGDESYTRAAFCAEVGHSLFDAFFNTSTGYRGAYFESPEKGLAANREMIDELATSLTAWAVFHDANVDQEWLAESLSLPSAKAWLAEDAAAYCQACRGGWGAAYTSEIHFMNGRWEHATHTHAAWGTQAPYLTKLRIFGGFVNDSHQEWVAGHKRARAQQIWDHGWT